MMNMEDPKHQTRALFLMTVISIVIVALLVFWAYTKGFYNVPA